MMDAETLIALHGSIAKWEAIVAGTGQDSGAANCPLCQKFIGYLRDDSLPTCTGCPVAIATGQPHCDGSPYENYAVAEEELQSEPEDDGEADVYVQRMAVAAQAEVEFLRGLLPAETADLSGGMPP